MAKRNKTGVLKRLREVKKAEKAAMKREQLERRKLDPAPPPPPEESTEPQIATRDDMAGYGFPVDEDPVED